MIFFDNVQATQISRPYTPAISAPVPLHRRLFPLQPSAADIARAAVREVLG